MLLLRVNLRWDRGKLGRGDERERSEMPMIKEERA
jgi:hypothetical protein